MKVLGKYEELVGKTIAFSHMAQFAEQITIGTEDGCVLMAKFVFDEYESNSTIHVLGEHLVLHRIQNNIYLQKELGKLGIFDLAAYQKEKEEREKKEAEVRKEKAEQRKIQAFFELQDLFADVDLSEERRKYNEGKKNA